MDLDSPLALAVALGHTCREKAGHQGGFRPLRNPWQGALICSSENLPFRTKVARSTSPREEGRKHMVYTRRETLKHSA